VVFGSGGVVFNEGAVEVVFGTCSVVADGIDDGAGLTTLKWRQS
jgi:hypothetical protein